VTAHSNLPGRQLWERAQRLAHLASLRHSSTPEDGLRRLGSLLLPPRAPFFGWIDSLVKRLDDDRYALKVTPRQATSKWSEINRRRWNDLKEAGLLAAPGLAAAPTGNRYAPRPSIPELPAYVAKALKTSLRAWRHFQALAPTYRRDFVVWIHTAKRPETRKKRIRESIELLAAGKKLGLK